MAITYYYLQGYKKVQGEKMIKTVDDVRAMLKKYAHCDMAKAMGQNRNRKEIKEEKVHTSIKQARESLKSTYYDASIFTDASVE